MELTVTREGIGIVKFEDSVSESSALEKVCLKLCDLLKSEQMDSSSVQETRSNATIYRDDINNYAYELETRKENGFVFVDILPVNENYHKILKKML